MHFRPRKGVILMDYQLRNIPIKITEEGLHTRLVCETTNVVVVNHPFTQLKPILDENFEIVFRVFSSRTFDSIPLEEVAMMSLKVVLTHLSLYSLWKRDYAKERNRDLRFNEKDLNSPMTYDTIKYYLEKLYPGRYRQKAALILGVSIAEFEAYEKGRKEMMDRR